jgi:hypothetical protein
MATARRPYSTIRNGEFQEVLAAGVSKDAALLYALSRTHPLKRSIPGLLHLGPAGLAETLKLKLSPTQRSLNELESHGFAIVDAAECLIYFPGAIEIDGPRTENSLRGMGIQCREMAPRSRVTRAVRTALEATLSIGEKPIEWLRLFSDLVGPAPDPGPGPDANPDAGPLPRSASASDPAAAAAAEPNAAVPSPADPFRRAWDRLPKPPFAAAANVDVYTISKRLSLEEFGKLVRALGVSKFLQGEGDLKTVPTLARLSNDIAYARRIISGEFWSRTVTTWRCAECGADHDPIGDCPPVCRDCQTPHAPERKCRHRKDREDCEAGEQARESGAAAKGIAAARAHLQRVGHRA